MHKSRAALEQRQQQAIDAAKRLSTVEPPPPLEEIRKAALDCFEAGVPDEARNLLDRFKELLGLEHLPWYRRFQSWLYAVDAKRRLANPTPIAPAEQSAIRDLANRLKKVSRFDLSRRLLARLLGEPEDLLAAPRSSDTSTQRLAGRARDKSKDEDIQRLSLSTYKDSDLQPALALDEAERLLKLIGLDNDTCADHETLGQGGAIYKRRWELTGRPEHLLQSLHYYRKGWEAINEDQVQADKDAYCGGNAAFVMDLLAEHNARLGARQADYWRTEAKSLRESIAEILASRFVFTTYEPTPDDRWALASLADTHFALGNYDEAGRYYAMATGLMEGDWERKTTFLQSLAVAQMQGIPLPEPAEGNGPFSHPAWNALHNLLGDRTAAALAGARPKAGLALSGGGFRAALYHLGVLARLAEVDALRHVEVISTVSGGSIVGTMYFLKLKKLLEGTPDNEITNDNYRDLVRELIGEFYDGVKENLRMRAFVSPKALLKMAIDLSYNRTLRMGELYDQYFFGQILGKQTPTLRDLIVAPHGASRDFSPRQDNWLRRAKVPILLINATNLNSGHSWQFAGSFMGEPPGLLEAEIDANERYARLHFEDSAQAEWQDFALGSAVAASSAVPALFSPVPLAGLYDGREVQLADGGVYDNQGVDTLLQENCALILCSDASGQLADDPSPSTLFLGVLRRTSDITMERDRIVEYQDLCSRLDRDALKGLLFLHLRQGLDIGRVKPAGETTVQRPQVAEAEMTDYGMPKDMQRLLSRIRTDLDSFTEIEANALMLSGYLATENQLQKQYASSGGRGDWRGFRNTPIGGSDWPFLAIKDVLCRRPSKRDAPLSLRANEIQNQLAASSKLFAKLFHLQTSWIAKGAMLMLTLGGLALLPGYLVIAFAGWIFGFAALAAAAIIPPWQKATMLRRLQRSGELAFALLIWPAAASGLYIFNRYYLKRGSLKRLNSLIP